MFWFQLLTRDDTTTPQALRSHPDTLFAITVKTPLIDNEQWQTLEVSLTNLRLLPSTVSTTLTVLPPPTVRCKQMTVSGRHLAILKGTRSFTGVTPEQNHCGVMERWAEEKGRPQLLDVYRYQYHKRLLYCLNCWIRCWRSGIDAPIRYQAQNHEQGDRFLFSCDWWDWIKPESYGHNKSHPCRLRSLQLQVSGHYWY